MVVGGGWLLVGGWWLVGGGWWLVGGWWWVTFAALENTTMAPLTPVKELVQ